MLSDNVILIAEDGRDTRTGGIFIKHDAVIRKAGDGG